MHTCLCSMHNGLEAFGTALNSSGGSNWCFLGSQRVVSEWTTRRRRSEKASDQQLQKVPSARTIARLMTSARDYMSKDRYRHHSGNRGRSGVPTLLAARTLTDRFHTMIRNRKDRF
jgi:hypothetical protein